MGCSNDWYEGETYAGSLWRKEWENKSSKLSINAYAISHSFWIMLVSKLSRSAPTRAPLHDADSGITSARKDMECHPLTRSFECAGMCQTRKQCEFSGCEWECEEMGSFFKTLSSSLMLCCFEHICTFVIVNLLVMRFYALPNLHFYSRYFHSYHISSDSISMMASIINYSPMIREVAVVAIDYTVVVLLSPHQFHCDCLLIPSQRSAAVSVSVEKSSSSQAWGIFG